MFPTTDKEKQVANAWLTLVREAVVIPCEQGWQYFVDYQINLQTFTYHAWARLATRKWLEYRDNRYNIPNKNRFSPAQQNGHSREAAGLYNQIISSIRACHENPVEDLKVQAAVELLYDLYNVSYSLERMED